ncbi:hypothetical protein MED193_07529 [Roseobacter sp. MED193]|uniref:DUF1127 domain-containing protein n=1 Tax=Roseobacter sp. MED193 TaxID=314262 RepID=UPI000068EEA3|nr:DUF1127 domain-containing protein [Roseobacter sp. MED193]EAQ46227.1 hypothetical protein MED193_07529 [Roseobacter sp. MED193]
MAAVNQIATPKSVLSFLPTAWFDELSTKFARYRLYRETYNELSELSGRELADLGLNRSMIKRLAYQAAYENN